MRDALEIAGSKIDSLETHKDALLSILRDAYEKGPKNKPFGEDKAWNAIFLTAGIHGERDIITDFPRPGKDDVRRYRQIAGALRKAHDLLTEEKDAETGSVIMDIWNQDIIGPPTHGVIEAGEAMLAQMQERYSALLDTLEQLARAADISAKDIQSRKGRGHPHGGSQLPDQIIIALAAIFREHTGLIPTFPSTRPMTKNRSEIDAGQTDFLRLVECYLLATNRHLTGATILNALKRAKVWSLKPENQGWTNSPFSAGAP